MNSATRLHPFSRRIQNLFTHPTFIVFVICTLNILLLIGLYKSTEWPFSLNEWLVICPIGLLTIALTLLLVKHQSKNKQVSKIVREIESAHSDRTKSNTQTILIGLENLSRLSYTKIVHIGNQIEIKESLISHIQLSINFNEMSLEDCQILDSQFGNSYGFKFYEVLFTRNTFSLTVFYNGEFRHVYYNSCTLRNCVFTKISFSDNQFDHVKMWNVQFKQCVFRNPIHINLKENSIEGLKLIVACGFICSRLERVDFEEVQFNGIDFTGTGLIRCNFINVSGLQPKDFYFAKTLYQTTLPEEIDRSLHESHPQLFIDPGVKNKRSNRV